MRGMDDITRQLQAGLQALGLDPRHAATHARYIGLLDKWNAAFNLTAVRDPAQMVSRHVLDSLSIAPRLHGARLLDVGTGAGLPGIPLAIEQPERTFVLLDTNGKKTRFVTQAVLELGLGNVTVVKSRVEDYRPEAGFDAIVSRAFASLADFVTLTRHLLAPGGVWLAMKAGLGAEERAALPAGVRLAGEYRLEVPGGAAARQLVELVADPDPVQ